MTQGKTTYTFTKEAFFGRLWVDWEGLGRESSTEPSCVARI